MLVGVKRWSRIGRPDGQVGDRIDLALAGVLALMTFVVHNVGYVLSTPYWSDESWVAISTKLPLGDSLHVTSSTPIGVTLLLRLVSFGYAPPLRLVPLVFSALTVVAAYLLARMQPWPSPAYARMAGILGGGVALMVPSSLLRNDLKQYTADAFVTLLVLILVSRLQSKWDRRRLIALGVTVVVAFFFSAVTVFVGLAAFGSILVVELSGRRWRRALEAGTVGAASGVLLLGTFLAVYRPGIPPGLTDFWKAYYVPVQDGWTASWTFLTYHSGMLARELGMGPLLLAVALVVSGITTLFVVGRTFVAVLVPLLVVEMIVLSSLKQYPFFDIRTSHFLTVTFGVLAAIGVAGIGRLLTRWWWPLPYAMAAVAMLVFLTGTAVTQEWRARTIPLEDMRTPVSYLAAHRNPSDIVVVNALGNFAFAYYWSGTPGGGGEPEMQRVSTNLQQFVAVFPAQPNILMAIDRDPATVDGVMDRAAAAAAAAGPGTRIWLIHIHTRTSELADYFAAAKDHHFRVDSNVRFGLDLLTPLGQ